MSRAENGPASDILESLLNRYEQGELQSALFAEIQEVYPHLEADFRQLVNLRDSLQQSGAADQPLPTIPDFRILREVGRGGMGVVYEAEQISLKRVVALKICRCDLSKNHQLRFNREQETLAKLHHSNIVPVHTSGRAGSWQYFAMKFIEGISLQEQLANERASYGRARQVTSAVERQIADTNSTAATAGSGKRTLQLPLSYYQSAARGMAEVAEALSHAHAVKLLHRDVKPSNIMVDISGTYWLVDFGLSRVQIGRPNCTAPELADQDGIESQACACSDVTQAGIVVGTPGYMPHDQYLGASSAQTDIYGLGVTLYEIFSLERAFESPEWHSKFASGETPEPIAIEEIAPTIPKDLAAICRKAMKANPAERYACAAQVAADLRHWLAGEPTQARPAGLARRFGLWSLRNKFLSVMLTTALVLLLFSSFAGWRWARSERSRTMAEHKFGEAERSRAIAAEALVESQLFELNLSRIINSRRNATEVGWRDRTLALISKASEFANTDTRVLQLRNEAVETFRSFDAKALRNIVRDSTSVAFDATGNRVLAGGYGDNGLPHVDAAVMMELETDSVPSTRAVGRPGAGPVGFQKDGTAVQLTWETMHALILWDIDGEQVKHRLLLPDGWQRDTSSRASSILSDDASTSAVPCINAEGIRAILVWSTTNRQLLFTFKRVATALAISHDNSLLATGEEDGAVSLWSLDSGKQLRTITNGHHRVQSLAFSHDSSEIVSSSDSHAKGKLVVGDAGSQAIIRDLLTGDIVCRLRGSDLWVSCAEFSPSGTMVATGSPLRVALWNALTGERLTQLDAGQEVVNVKFSHDGSRLASVSTTTFSPGHICVWEIENGRGAREYQGLGARVAQALYSPDDTLVAALSQDGEVAVWERSAGRLLYKFTVPPADYIDNTKIGFSVDGRTLYYCGQQSSIAWDALTGSVQLGPLTLNPALGNRLAFPATGEVLVLRYETQLGTQIPDSSSNRETDPRVFRVYHLNGDAPSRPVHEFYFTGHDTADPRLCLIDEDASFDGSVFVIEATVVPVGMQKSNGKRFVKAFDSLTGRELFSTETHNTTLCRCYHFPLQSRDESARVIGISLADAPSSRVYKHLSTGESVDSLPTVVRTDGAPFHSVMISHSNKLAMEVAALLRRVSIQRDGFVTPVIERRGETEFHGFSNSGDHWMESTRNGTITVFDLQHIHSNLRQMQLGWEE